MTQIITENSVYVYILTVANTNQKHKKLIKHNIQSIYLSKHIEL